MKKKEKNLRIGDLEGVGEAAELAEHLDDGVELRSLDRIAFIKPSFQYSENRSRGITGPGDPTLQSVVGWGPC